MTPLRALGCALSFLFVSGPLAFAQEPEGLAAPSVGVAGDGLPGFGRVGVVTVSPSDLALVAALGYGMTEELGNEGGSHDRFLMGLGVAYHPVDWLGLSLRFDGRYDTHPDDMMGPDDGLVGDPRVGVRAGTELGTGFGVGLDLSIWLPGNEAPSFVFGATTVEASVLASFSPGTSGLTVGSKVGFRLDNTTESIDDITQFRPGDRLALGLNDANAVLLGLGAAYRTGAIELLGELSWDLLVGSAAPSATTSPMRATLGGRYHLSQAMQAGITTDVALSSRPSASDNAIVAVEPRFTVLLGFAVQFGFDSEPEVVPDDPIDEPLPTPTEGRIAGRVLGAENQPLNGAQVELRVGETTRQATTDTEGAYVFEGVQPGSVIVAVTADGYQAAEVTVSVVAGQTATPETTLIVQPRMGQLRGLVRSFTGHGLEGTIRVEPGDLQASCDAEGRFEIELAPGDYEVAIEAPGHQGQRRQITVEVDGVTVLNADLRRGR